MYKISLDKEEGIRCGNLIKRSFYRKLTIPRNSVRIANSLRFSIPILVGEVNTVDLIILEAIKILYPAFFAFIVKNESLLVGGRYGNTGTYFREADILEEHKAKFGELLMNFEHSHRPSIIYLVHELFPKSRLRYNPSATPFSTLEIPTNEELDRDKRIASTRYYWRYLAFSIGSKDISDTIFGSFLEAHKDAKLVLAKSFVDVIGPSSFFSRIRDAVHGISNESIQDIIYVLGELSPSYSNEHQIWSFDRGEVSAAARLIIDLFQISEVQISPYIKDFITNQGTFELAFEIWHVLDYNYQQSEAGKVSPLLDIEYYDGLLIDLKGILVDRALALAANAPIYRVLPDYAGYILTNFWPNTKNKFNLQDYLELHLNTREDVGLFLRQCAGQIVSTRHGTYYDYMSNDMLEVLHNILDPFLCDKVVHYLSPDSTFDFVLTEREGEPELENRLKQYAQFCTNRKQGIDIPKDE